MHKAAGEEVAATVKEEIRDGQTLPSARGHGSQGGRRNDGIRGDA